jgi:3'5'-cyclic nucleotide phosphodiesterase
MFVPVVTMAVDKFLSRIETPDIDQHAEVDAHGLASQIHDFTHGITSDPTTVLAIVFAALVHDADHRGVSNQQLAKEDVQMADLYENQSIAEQHSLDKTWDILMDGDYHELRLAIFGDRAEMMRFRQVFVNVVLATDIFDKQLNDLRKNRWDKAFNNDNGVIDSDLRATIVIEHIIQASDVAHTMQHWHVYRKWNERLYEEMHEAYRSGRMAKDPAEFWYQGELVFFDNYIIPLARKLRECNVFGVSSGKGFVMSRLFWITFR